MCNFDTNADAIAAVDQFLDFQKEICMLHGHLTKYVNAGGQRNVLPLQKLTSSSQEPH